MTDAQPSADPRGPKSPLPAPDTHGRPGHERSGHAPPSTRLYAVGDIHGRRDLLDRVQAKIAADLAHGRPKRAVVIYLGDYVDREPESRAAIERLIHHPVAGAESVHLKGNHEYLMLRARANEPRAAELWLSNGGDAILRGYGLEENVASMAAELPATHRTFLSGLPLYRAEGSYMFVHAGI